MRNSIDAVVNARRLWLGFTIAYLAGIFVPIQHTSPPGPYSSESAIVSVALLALVPVFLRWSLQVRTDQPALMFATWASVVLLGSTRRLVLALTAGVLFALGFVCSQKAAYVGALGFVLLAFQVFSDRKHTLTEWRRWLAIPPLAAASFIVTFVTYRFLVSLFYEPSAVSLQAGIGSFDYYRRTFGYRAYWAMMPTLTTCSIPYSSYIVRTDDIAAISSRCLDR